MVSRWGDLFCLGAGWKNHLVKEHAKEPRPRCRPGDYRRSNGARQFARAEVGEAGTAVDKNSGALVWQSAKTIGLSTPLPVQRGASGWRCLGQKKVSRGDIKTGKKRGDIVVSSMA